LESAKRIPYKIIKRIYSMDNRYTPHPKHLILLFIFIMIAAVVAAAVPHWTTAVAFVAVVIICVAAGLWIAWAGKTREEADYWWNIGNDIADLRKSSPNIWKALGINDPPEKVHLEMNITGTKDASPYLEVQRVTYNLSAVEMQFLADELLSGKRTLAESEWKHTLIGSTKVRNLKHELLRDKLIGKANNHASTQGFLLTDKGVDYLLKYASEWLVNSFDISTFNIIVTDWSDRHPPVHVSSPS
jgi:hypothetical protein